MDSVWSYTPFSFTTQPPSWGLLSAPAAWLSPRRPRTLDLGFLPVPGPKGSLTEWLPKDFPSNVTPKGSIWMWVLRVKGVMGRTRGGYSCSESEVSMRWGVFALGFLCKWHCSGLGQTTYEYPTWASKDILGLGANIHFYFPFESYSTVWAYLVTSWWRQPVAKLVTGQPYSQRIWWAYSLH